MRLRRGSILGAVALLATIACAGTPAAGLAADDDPLVLSVASLDPHSIKDVPNPSALATLHLPPGRWAAWAVVRYSIDVAVSFEVDCWTKVMSGAELDRHTVHAVTHGTLWQDTVPFSNVAMSVVANVTSGRGATVSVRCRGPWGVAREVRIVAMRAGTLTKVTPRRTTTWGKGSPVVRQSRSAGSQEIQVVDPLPTIASLDLGAGRWWVRAHLSLQGTGYGPAPGPSTRVVECRLKFGGDTDTSYSLIDDEFTDVEDTRSVLTMEVAAAVQAPSTAQLRCAADDQGVTVHARDIRITAVRADRLTLGSAAKGATHTTTGKGQPWVTHLLRTLASVASGGWTTVGRLPVTAGRWFVTAKYAYDREFSSAGGDVQCRLRLSNATNTTETRTKATGDGIPLQLVGRVNRRGPYALLECRQLDATVSDDTLQQVRMTAIRVR